MSVTFEELQNAATCDRYCPGFAYGNGSSRPRLCENACAILKSALLRKICQRLVNQQAVNLSRNAIFVAVLTVKPTSKRFYTAWTQSSHLDFSGQCEVIQF